MVPSTGAWSSMRFYLIWFESFNQLNSLTEQRYRQNNAQRSIQSNFEQNGSRMSGGIRKTPNITQNRSNGSNPLNSTAKRTATSSQHLRSVTDIQAQRCVAWFDVGWWLTLFRVDNFVGPIEQQNENINEQNSSIHAEEEGFSLFFLFT